MFKNPLIIIAILLVLVVLTSSKREHFNSIYKSYPKRLNYKKCKTQTKTNIDAQVWEKRFPGLVAQRYSFNDHTDSLAGRDKCRTPCDTRFGAELKSVPVNYKNQWKTKVDSRLLKDYPLLNADAKTAQLEEARTRMPEGHLYNLAKKSKCIKPYSVSDFIPGRYTTRNQPGNYYHLGSA